MPRFSWSPLAAGLVATGLLVGPGGAAWAQSAPAPARAHVVQSGETLSQIALDAGVDADAIAALNGLGDLNVLAIGQSLKLPVGAPSPAGAAAPSGAQASTTYTVADGDTLWDIAQRLGITTDALQQLNNLDDPSRLSLGMSLKVPGKLTASSPASASAPTSAPASKNLLVSYTVQPGETLNQIAHQFDVRSDAIVQASGLADANKLSAGAVLKVPLPAKQHVVQDGETLRDIAAAEKVDLGTLIDFNQMDDPELIRVGQTVLVPVAATQQAAASDGPSGSVAAATAAAPAAAPVPPPPAAAPKPTPTPTPKPTAAPTAKPTAAPAASGAASAAPKPKAPVAVVSPPPGAPTDGMAGAGLKLLGSPYVWGGSSPTGFDCSGFVWYIARQVGKPLTRGMFGQYNSGSHPARDSLQPGDLVFFQNTFASGLSHNGIYIGNGQFVHAADEAAGVTISSLNTAYWSSHWFGATRLP